MLELRIISAGTAVPLFDLPATLGRNQAARQIGDTIEGLIAFMDELGGDPELEDSETGSHLVDATGRYLGDAVPDWQDQDREPDDDAQGDVGWIEWQSRGTHKLEHGGERLARDPAGDLLHEDAEDDDPDTSVEDDPLGFDPEQDFGAEELGEPEDTGGDTFTTPMALTEQCDRIRRTRCTRTVHPGRSGSWGYSSHPTWEVPASPTAPNFGHDSGI